MKEKRRKSKRRKKKRKRIKRERKAAKNHLLRLEQIQVKRRKKKNLSQLKA